MRPMRHQQHGSTLLISLIMLVLLTLLAVSSFNMGKSSLQTVGNMQHRNEALAAAQETIEQVISTTLLFAYPSGVIPAANSGCPNGGADNTKCIDTNQDGEPDIAVSLTPTPTCIKAQPIANIALNPSIENDKNCFVGATQSLGVAGANSGNSLCADSIWEVTAVAEDAITNAQYSVTQGLAVRIRTDQMEASCP